MSKPERSGSPDVESVERPHHSPHHPGPAHAVLARDAVGPMTCSLRASVPPRRAVWYAKSEITFSDVFAAIRRKIRIQQAFSTSQFDGDMIEIPRAFDDGLIRCGASANRKRRHHDILGSQRLTGALLDRLTHHVSILAMNGNSYRLKQSVGRRRATTGAEQNQATETVDPARSPGADPRRPSKCAKGPDRSPLHITPAHRHWPAFTPPRWPEFGPPLTAANLDSPDARVFRAGSSGGTEPCDCAAGTPIARRPASVIARPIPFRSRPCAKPVRWSQPEPRRPILP